VQTLSDAAMRVNGITRRCNRPPASRVAADRPFRYTHR
jgi:hypothetical protein